MNRKTLIASTLIATLTITLLTISRAAEPAKDAKTAPAQPEMKLPPGWTMEDMQACIQAGTPGKMQEYLTKGAGVWRGKNTMWMAPDSEPIKAECTCTITSIMDGRYVKAELKGEMPGMGAYNGLGIYGFDNVSQKFTSTLIDNQGTGIMTGTGELSADGKVLTWTYTFNCPLTKKPLPMREIETITGPKTKTLEIFSTEPKSGKEFKMMVIEFTKE